MQDLAQPMPRPTAQVAPYMDVLGPELVVDFLLQFGGAELYLAENPKGRSDLEALIGQDRARALASHVRIGQYARVPLAKRWLASVLCWQGYSNAMIARKLRVADVSVRRWEKAGKK